MNIYKQILGALIISILINACTKMDNDSNAPVNENYKLKQQLSTIKKESKEDQQAIFQYMTFVDSVDKMLNKVFVDFIKIQNIEGGKKYDKKKDLLEKLNSLVNKLNKEESKNKSLEKKMKGKDYQGNKLVIQLKKERLLQIERITKLQSQIDSLIIKIELQEKQILENEKQIKQQNEKIQSQEETIANKDLELQKTSELLKKKYVILVSKKTTKRIELKESYVIIPAKKRKIRLQMEDKEFCSMISLSKNKTKLIVDSSFWKNSRILTVKIAGWF